MKKLIVALSNRNGCSVKITNKISEKLSIDKIILRENNVQNCIGCLNCHNHPSCILNDDMNLLYDKVLNSDLLVFVTPNYFDGLSGFAKNFFDRLHPFYKFPKLENKKVIFIFVGGGNADGTLEEMNNSIKGVIKYLRFDIIKNFALKSLNVIDLDNKSSEIDEIINFINLIK